jgi:Ca-activated chloride channel family protein
VLELLPSYSEIYWRDPWWLLLALQPLIMSLLQHRKRRQSITAYADPELLPWVLICHREARGQVIAWRRVAGVLVWILFAVSIAGPRLLLDGDQTQPRAQGDILLLVDASRSMRVADSAIKPAGEHLSDWAPSRLRRAQIELDEFLSLAPGHRVGIILFSARAHVYVPLTADYKALRHYLAHLDKLVLPSAGSRPGTAIDLANHLLEASSAAAMVLISDGDWPIDQSITESPHPIFVLGLGSADGGGIPIGEGQWLMHDGQPVISRLDEKRLRQFSREHRGDYSRAERDDRDWRRLYQQGITRHLPHRSDEATDEATGQATNDQLRWRELYHWTLVPALVLLLLSVVSSFTGIKQTLVPLLLLGLPSLLLLPPGNAKANDLQQAYEHYRQQDYDGALPLYRQLGGFQGRLGQGVAYYRLAAYHKAVGRFIDAVLLAERDTDRATALFNLGNSYFQLGDYANAATSFGDALLYRPDHEASRFNRALSRSLQAAVDEATASARAGRSGSGPAEARVSDGTVVSPDTSASLDDNSPNAKPSPPLSRLTNGQFRLLLKRGLAQARLADERDARLPKEIQQARASALADARLRMEMLQDNEAQLWIRLFEREEGIPAPLQEPITVPGLLPW